MEKSIKIIFLIGAIMFILGVVFYFAFTTTSNNSHDNSEKEKTNSIKFQKKRCSDNICISSVTIEVKDGNSYITGKIINKSSTDIEEGVVKLIFKLDDGREIHHYYEHSLLKSKESSSFEISLPIDYAISTKDCLIEKLTEEELVEYNNLSE